MKGIIGTDINQRLSDQSSVLNSHSTKGAKRFRRG